MVNKKKRSTKVAACEIHSSGIPSESTFQMMQIDQINIQSADLIEIKQEADIKPEPVSVGEFVEVSVLIPSGIQNHHEYNQRSIDYDFDGSTLDEVKVKVKKEVDEKKEKVPETNSDNGKVVDKQQDKRSPPQDEVNFAVPESDNNTQNAHNQAINANGKPLKPHKCEFCEYSARYKSAMNRHLLQHTGKKPHECHLCTKRFTQKQYLRDHMKVHVEEFLFHCSICLQGFDGKNEKTEHEMDCKIRRYECHLCGESFGSMKTQVIRHMRVHSGKRPFECKECFKQFKQKGHLNDHIKLHTGPHLFRCSKCDRKFSHQDERNVHEEKCNRHEYKCDICGKSFGLKKSNLICHMRIHSGEKPFECQHCSKKFSQKYNLHSHMRTHSGNKPFQCKLCQGKFTRKSNLKKHVNHFHNINSVLSK